MRKILIIDRQIWIMDLVNNVLKGDSYSISVAEDAEMIEKLFQETHYDLVLLSFYLQHGHNSRNVLKHIKTKYPDLPVIILAEWDKNLDRSLLASADGIITDRYNTESKLEHQLNKIFDPGMVL